MFLDQLMDAVISSTWTAYLVFNLKVYEVSPLILIAVYLILGGIVLCRVGTFSPLVRRAREARAERQRTSGEFTLSRRKSCRTKWSMTRGATAVCVFITECVEALSNAVKNEQSETRLQRESAQSAAWQSINHVGVFSSAPFKTHFLRPAALTSTNSLATINNPYRKKCDALPAPLPFKKPKTFRRPATHQTRAIRTEILQMRTTEKESGPSTAVVYRRNRFTTDIFGVDENDIMSSLVDSHAVATHSWIRDRARIFTDVTETTVRPEVALTRMLRRHCLGAEAYEWGDVLGSLQEEEAKRSFVLIGELIALLHWCWGMFHPGGRMLNEEAKEETVQSLIGWHSYQMSIKVAAVGAAAADPFKVDHSGSRSFDYDEEGYMAQLSKEDMNSVGRISTSETFSDARAAERVPAESLSGSMRDAQVQITHDSRADGMTFDDFSAWFLLLASKISNIHCQQGDRCV